MLSNVVAAKSLRIMLQCGRNRQIAVDVAPNDPLGKAFKAFGQAAIKNGWMRSPAQLKQLQFVFDEEPLSWDATATKAGLEEDDVVDVLGMALC